MHEYRELMTRQRAKEVRMMAFGTVMLLIVCIGVALAAQNLSLTESGLAPTSTPSAIVVPATPLPPVLTWTSAPAPTDVPTLIQTSIPMPTDRLVLIPTNAPMSVGSPVPTDTPAPTNTPLPTPTSTATPTPEPLFIPFSDSQADVVSYDGLVPVQQVPAGVDIRAASVDADLRVALQTTEGVPAELSGWAEGEVLLWIALYEPISDPPAVYTEWIFALDLDGDIETGRPAGSLRINPDIGIEVAVGAYYDPGSGEYGYYSLVWDPAQGSWADGPTGIHYILSESRTLVGFALPLETLAQSAAQVTGVIVVPGAARGRAAALAIEGQKVIDFYPDRPY